ncbi:hypothetical protein ACFCT7_10815 [Fulvivirgaceae bacterium LMO-SS25]
MVVESEYDNFGRKLKESTYDKSGALNGNIVTSYFGSTSNIDRIENFNAPGVLQNHTTFDQYNGDEHAGVRNFNNDTLESGSTFMWRNCQTATIE